MLDKHTDLTLAHIHYFGKYNEKEAVYGMPRSRPDVKNQDPSITLQGNFVGRIETEP
jgi:hypothetical protein